MGTRILHGDCRELLRTLPDASVDAVVTDPPYDLPGGFMGKAWDRSGVAFDPAMWEAVKRVLKPGGHLLAFGGTRTFHRMTVAIEDAGFEIRDTLSWLYGSGFPKSRNLDGEWAGWGTALKPAWEPIILARKPLAAKSVAANVLAHGTGALNVDGCRVAGDMSTAHYGGKQAKGSDTFGQIAGNGYATQPHTSGRWPANVALDEAAAAALDEMSGELHARGNRMPTKRRQSNGAWAANGSPFGIGPDGPIDPGDTGGASRFFLTVPADDPATTRFLYCPKASRAERNRGLDGMPERAYGLHDDDAYRQPGERKANHTAPQPAANHHPTVKPIALMQWLVRLVTPPGGTVLDPFLGSGTTGIAAQREGFSFIGIEREAEYIEIARRRIAADAPLLAEAAD